ncbi:MAG: carboxypeptidase-like regulatory domain-containing protein [Gemmataceae bacterium]
MSRLWAFVLCVALSVLAGCGSSSGPKLIAAAGKVTYKDKALSGATVSFFPVEGAEGTGGSGTTDAEGNYKIAYARGGEGLPAGKYKVTISKRLMPDGSAPPPDVAPMDSPAKETLPPIYSELDRTTLKAEVKEGATHNFDLPK